VTGWLVVRSAERTLALPVGMVEELVAVPPPLSVPGVVAAVRGVAPFQGRLVPLCTWGGHRRRAAAARARDHRVAVVSTGGACCWKRMTQLS
jgi:chemotaxis signal transduction protein